MAHAHHDDALQQLCAHFGIATDYHDIWGTRIPVAREGLEALLAEFDVRLDAGHGPASALASARDAAWSQSLPPVAAVAADSAAWSLPVRLPAALDRLRWRIDTEDGRTHEGELDAHGFHEEARIDRESAAWCRRRVVWPFSLPPGYHRLRVDGLAGETLVVAAPARCWRPESTRDGGRVWGPAVQLYALRSPRNWGIGDFGDLRQLVATMGARGADVVGLNPLHALFSHNPAHASPYSPSSRQQLNVLYIDVEAVEDFAACEPARRLVRGPDFQARLAALREQEMVDHAGVAAAKFEVLELLFAHFGEQHLKQGDADPAARDFLRFVAERGEPLERHARFEALQAHFYAADPACWGWQVWPESYRDPAGAAVAAFAAEHADRVQFHQYLQWRATQQLARAGESAREAGMTVGLYVDLAVSVDRAGSDAWGAQRCFASGATVGAPPDEFNPNGQGWGLPPLRPDRLREDRYAFFIETVRANMRGAGALRIDHVMGLMRLYWIPPGRTARDGAYVYYTIEEMLAIVALESQRNRCMVIGEDLGTVADEMRAALSRFDVLSYRLLYFERQDQVGFKPPSAFPANALVSVSTHDLATLPGWWAGRDLQVRLALDLFPNIGIFEKQLLDRAQERVQLLLGASHAGLLSPEEVAEATSGDTLPSRVVTALHAHLATAPSALIMMQLEDVLGVVDQANLPGTTDQHPNWRRKLPLDLHVLAQDARLVDTTAALAAARPRRGASVDAAAVAGPRTEATVPRATYRLQFHKDFGFDDAIEILPYLARLGVSHVYCSPIQRARAGSMHGYDVVAHDEVNPELGGREGFERFSAALRAQGMGQLLDMVPNHMGVLGADNAWWMDVLENGPASLYAQHFDIDWQPLNEQLTGKVLVPVLGGSYGEVLEGGELVLHFEPADGAIALRYFEHRFPLAPERYAEVLDAAAARVDDTDLAALLGSVASAFGHLPGRDAPHDAARAERARDKTLLKARLARLTAREPAVMQAIGAAVAELNLPGARDRLHALIEAQPWRLAHWRVASDEINYRRFFDINDLAALRMERDEVFEATQSFALDLAAAGVVDGLRIDHPDGLYDPARYFRQLQEGFVRRSGGLLAEHDAAGRPARPLYVVAEKIAAPHEEVPESWHVHGTTGYRFANVANGVLLDANAAGRFGAIWRNFTGVTTSFESIARTGKRDIMRTALSSELNVLSTELLRIARADRRTRDYTLNALRRALAETAACMTVYRTYVIDDASEQDRHFIESATRDAAAHTESADLSVFEFLRKTLQGAAVEGAAPALAARVRRFAIRFQQFSAPVAAKGVEDTAFYRYFPLSSINEVGGEPGIFGMTVDEFHVASADRAKRWPHTMLATSTHDNKRSEDVRNRIDVLSEMPATWRLALRRWRRMTTPVRERLVADGMPAEAPSARDEYLLYQTLLGTLPHDGLDEAGIDEFKARILRYMQKSAREAKLCTRWTQPDAGYEAGLEAFIDALLGRVADNLVLADMQALATRLAWFGAFNSLSLVLLKYASPGVPDLYQGNELMDLSLVDPDNRRPVDYALRAQRLRELEAMAAEPDLSQRVASLARNPFDGRAKLWIVSRLLALRAEQPALFRDGDYDAVPAQGEKAPHVIAFVRRHQGQVLVVVAARLFAAFAAAAADGDLQAERRLPCGDVWGDTELSLPGVPDGAVLRDRLSGARHVVHGGRIRVAAALATFPGAALLLE